jgi:hypothetical protein
MPLGASRQPVDKALLRGMLGVAHWKTRVRVIDVFFAEKHSCRATDCILQYLSILRIGNIG